MTLVLRVCPGRWLALDTVWVTIASTLAVYNIEKPKNANGVVIEQPLEFTGAAVRYDMSLHSWCSPSDPYHLVARKISSVRLFLVRPMPSLSSSKGNMDVNDKDLFTINWLAGAHCVWLLCPWPNSFVKRSHTFLSSVVVSCYAFLTSLHSIIWHSLIRSVVMIPIR